MGIDRWKGRVGRLKKQWIYAIKKELYSKDSSQLTSFLCHLYRPRGFYMSK